MKHLKVYEDYADKELEDLMGDLEDVGLVSKVRVSCMVEGCIPHPASHPSWWTEYLQIFAIVVLVDRGSEGANKEFALKGIQKGDFDQTLESKVGGKGFLQMVSPEISKIFTKENIQNLAKGSPTLDSLLQRVKERMVEAIAKEWGISHERFTANMTEEELKNFYSVDWRSSPEKIREHISRRLLDEIKIKKLD